MPPPRPDQLFKDRAHNQTLYHGVSWGWGPKEYSYPTEKALQLRRRDTEHSGIKQAKGGGGRFNLILFAHCVGLSQDSTTATSSCAQADSSPRPAQSFLLSQLEPHKLKATPRPPFQQIFVEQLPRAWN